MLGKAWLKIGTHWDLHTHALIAASNAPCTDDIHDARQIVGEYAERHLARDLRQRLHQKVRRAHPHLERAEGMLNRLAPTAHGLGILIQPLLHGFDNVLMLPSRDPAFFARSAL